MLHITSSFLKDYSMDGFVIELLEQLDNNRFPYMISSTSFVGKAFPDKYRFRFSSRKPTDFQLVINPACFLHNFGIDKQTIIYTVWDSTMLPVQYVNEINKARLCIVPSEETKRVFQNSCVTIPIEVINHWFHSNVFYKNPSWKPNFTFGSAGQIVEEPKVDKKNLQNLIDTFQDTFKNNESVTLKIKTSPESKDLETNGDSRVEILKKDINSSDMCKWYNSLDYYVNVSRYESFGRHMLEALGCHIPLITPFVGGPVEYLKMCPDLYHPVGYKTVHNSNPDSIYKNGYWYEPNLDELSSVMYHVFRNETKISTVNPHLFTGKLDDSRFEVITKNFDHYSVMKKFVKVLSRFTGTP
jgi:glycosyltransferase involved in cell wall biosynthesis